MRHLSHTAILRAEPEQVFDLLRHVPNFVDLCEQVKAIEDLGDEQYRWTVRAAGLTLHFDVEICTSKRPHHLAWRSVRGVRNQGHYHLTTEGPNQTRVEFALYYKLGSPLLEATVRRATKTLVERISNQLMTQAQARLDAESD